MVICTCRHAPASSTATTFHGVYTPFAPDGWYGATPRTPYAISQRLVRRQKRRRAHNCQIGRNRPVGGRRPRWSVPTIRAFASDESIRSSPHMYADAVQRPVRRKGFVRTPGPVASVMWSVRHVHCKRGVGLWGDRQIWLPCPARTQPEANQQRVALFGDAHQRGRTRPTPAVSAGIAAFVAAPGSSLSTVLAAAAPLSCSAAPPAATFAGIQAARITATGRSRRRGRRWCWRAYTGVTSP